eukprot:Pgem_evm1s6394
MMEFYWLVTGVNSAGKCTTTSKTEDNDECDGTKGKSIGHHRGTYGNEKDACGCIKGQTGWSQHKGKCTTTSKTEDNDECD